MQLYTLPTKNLKKKIFVVFCGTPCRKRFSCALTQKQILADVIENEKNTNNPNNLSSLTSALLFLLRCILKRNLSVMFKRPSMQS